MVKMTEKELNLIREWFNAVQDLNDEYLDINDYKLAGKIYKILGLQIPDKIFDEMKRGK
jgi:hypothetical protein